MGTVLGISNFNMFSNFMWMIYHIVLINNSLFLICPVMYLEWHIGWNWRQERRLLIDKSTRQHSRKIGDVHFWELAAFYDEQFEQPLNHRGMNVVQHVILEHFRTLFIRRKSIILLWLQNNIITLTVTVRVNCSAHYMSRLPMTV